MTQTKRFDVGGAAAPSRDELRRARGFALERRRHLFATAPPPDSRSETERLGKFACSVAHSLVGHPRYVRPPELMWFPANRTNAAFMVPGRHRTYVALDRRGQELVKSVLHEAKHHSQDWAGTVRDCDAEPEAAEFAERWVGAVLAAFRWTDGWASRVVVRTGPPFRDVPRGHVVLSEGGLFNYNSFNKGNSWSRVS